MISLYNYLVEYINKNKEQYNINYKESIETLKELLKDIEEDYKKAKLID